jgi:maleylacetoacetate isomerase
MSDDSIRLYNFYRSSASFRVRMALALKQLPYEYVTVSLTWEGGQNFAPDYRSKNPFAMVPTLEHRGLRITESLAICEYLEEVFPIVPLLPRDVAGRARVRSLASSVACGIQPLNNLRVEKYITDVLHVTREQRHAWTRHWIDVGFIALETVLSTSPQTGTFCHGESPTLADCFLVPQVANARRSKIDLAPYPTIRRIEEACLARAEIAAALPERQPDAPRTS